MSFVSSPRHQGARSSLDELKALRELQDLRDRPDGTAGNRTTKSTIFNLNSIYHISRSCSSPFECCMTFRRTS